MIGEVLPNGLKAKQRNRLGVPEFAKKQKWEIMKGNLAVFFLTGAERQGDVWKRKLAK